MLESAVLPHPPRISRVWVVIAWFVAGLAMFYVIDRVPLTRTQEARVLVGAREMLGKPLEGWLIPQANGEPRLRKPPLAYWLSAGSYHLFGYGVTQGRVPALVSAWLTLCFTYLIGRRLFDSWVGLYSAGCLFGSWLFFRYTLLSETDGLVMCQMTVAAYALLRARQSETPDRKWLYLAMFMASLMALTKGPPAGYVVLMMVALDATGGRLRTGTWRRSLVWQSIRSGAFLLPLLLALPWFLYALQNADGGQLTSDMANSMKGGLGHSEYFWMYFPMLMLALAPWSIIWIVAGIQSLIVLDPRPRRVSDNPDRPSLLFLYSWGASIFIPLLLWGNKQAHYLLPLVPAMMLSVGWALARARHAVPVIAAIEYPRLRGTVRVILMVMLIIAVVSIPLPLLGSSEGHITKMTHLTAVAAMGITAVCLFLFAVVLKKLELAETVILAVIAGLVIVIAGWLPALEEHTPRTVAAELRERFPHGEFVFRSQASLPLCAEMAQVIPVWDDFYLEIATQDSLIRHRLVCIDATSDHMIMPDGYQEVVSIQDGENTIIVSVVESTGQLDAGSDSNRLHAAGAMEQSRDRGSDD